MIFKSCYFHLMVFSLLLTLISCKQKTNKYTPTTTKISGQISDLESPIMTLKGLEEIKVTVDPKGSFAIQTDLINAGIYTLGVNYFSTNIFVIPGDNITIKCNARDPQSLKFEGDHANENNYLVQYEILKGSLPDQDFANFYGQNEQEFIKKVEARTQLLIHHQQEFQKNNAPFDEVFAAMLIDQITYDAASIKMNYPTYFQYLFPDSNLVLTDTYDSFLQNIDLDKADNLLLPAYVNFLPLYLDFKTKADTTATEKSLFVNKFNNISTKFQTQAVKDLMYYQLMKEGLETSVNDVATVIDEYSKVQHNDAYNQEVNGVFNGWRHLLKGKTAPTWEYESVDGKKISLSSFLGKVVYVDIWATWCGPCLRELPFLEKLQSKYKNENDLVFVSLSIDADKSSWSTMVKSKKMEGIQLIADKDWNSKIVSDYRISGIPRFLIIGKDGNIIDANAPRPSSKELTSVLNQAVGIED